MPSNNFFGDLNESILRIHNLMRLEQIRQCQESGPHSNALDDDNGASVSANCTRPVDRSFTVIEGGKGAMTLTNHAVERFIERVDPTFTNDEILEFARNSVPFKKGDERWCREIGVVFVVNRQKRVVTVLSREQSAKFVGRKLKDGSRVIANDQFGAGT